MTTFIATLEPAYPGENILWQGNSGSALSVSDPTPLPTLTIRAVDPARNSGSMACVTATTAKTFVAQIARMSSSAIAQAFYAGLAGQLNLTS